MVQYPLNFAECAGGKVFRVVSPRAQLQGWWLFVVCVASSVSRDSKGCHQRDFLSDEISDFWGGEEKNFSETSYSRFLN